MEGGKEGRGEQRKGRDGRSFKFILLARYHYDD
jgi:hypothetical protein